MESLRMGPHERLEYLIKYVHALSFYKDAHLYKEFNEANQEIQKLLGLCQRKK